MFKPPVQQYSSADRALNTEAQALEAEISRIADDTTWAEIQILDGSVTNDTFSFQIGPDGSDTIIFTIPDMGHEVNRRFKASFLEMW